MTIAKSVRGFLEYNDMRLMKRVHRWKAPRWLRRWTLLITRLGDGWLWYALALIILFFGGEKRYVAVSSGLAASLAGIFVFRKLKVMSKRPRPYQVEPHCWAMITPQDRFSFPSGHSMTAFAITVSVGHFYSNLELLLLVLALSIAASRIILGMHYLTDVMAGAAIGIGLGLASLSLFSVDHMIRILIVEDDRDIAELVQYNLQADGLEVIVVPDGRPALCELQRGGFDLLVLDLMLPTLSGLEVCKAVRCNPNLSQLPILIMTARGEEAIRTLAFAMGASDYLVKPFRPCELVARVRNLLRCSQTAAEIVEAPTHG